MQARDKFPIGTHPLFSACSAVNLNNQVDGTTNRCLPPGIESRKMDPVDLKHFQCNSKQATERTPFIENI